VFWRGVWGYLPANLVQGVVGVLSIVVFTRLLTPEQYGVYALGFSAMTVAHTLVFTWMEAAMARFFPAEQARGGLPGHFATLYRAFLWISLAFLPLSALAVWLWPAGDALKIAVGSGLAAIVARSLVRLVQERRRAAGEVASASALDMGQTAGGFALGAVLALLGFGGAGPLLGLALAALLCLPPALPRELRWLKGGRFEADRLKGYAAYGLPLSASLILALALGTADRFLIAGFLDAGSVGAYHAAYSLSNRTLDVIFVWLGAAGGPALVMALEHGGRDALKRAAEEQASTILLVALPAAVGVALVARPLAELMVGEGLREAVAGVTPWIAFAALFAGATTYYFHQAFTLARRTPLLLAAMAFPAAANLILNVVLIPRFGLIGAAWAATAGYAVGLVASWALGKRAGGLPTPWTTLGKCGLASAAMAAAVVAVPAVGGALELAAKAAVGASVYGAVAWILDAADVRTHTSRLLKSFRAGRTA
jgi:O-antigen/teichoic acid export membrane protein